MSTFCHGIASCQVIDKSGEIVEIKGLDITSLARTGLLNFEHKSDIPGQICGKILTAKKIFTKEDCSNPNELYFWNKCQAPFVYIIAELLDNYCQSGKDAAGLFRYDHVNKGKHLPILGFSVEGSELPNSRPNKMTVARSIARKVTLTASPCNSLCTAELLEEEKPSQVQDDFSSIFKSESEAIEMFKTEQGVQVYEIFLAKKEDLTKTEPPHGLPPGWNHEIKPSSSGQKIHISKFGHAPITIHHEEGKYHVKQAGTHAGIGGVKGIFNTDKEAVQHAQKYVHGIHSGRIPSKSMHNVPSAGATNKSESSDNTLQKTLTAGNTNAAPSTLTDGAAYQVESLGSKPKKTDWNKRAKEDYQKWPHKEKFEKFMAARMPHLQRGEIEAIGRTIALGKSLDFEKSLSKLTKK